MKKSLSFALMGAAVLSLFSCKGNTPSTSSSVPSTSSSSSSSSPQKEFHDEQLGLMKGHFIGENYELDISLKGSTLTSNENGSSRELRIIDITTEKYISSTLDNQQFDVDYVYFEDPSEVLQQYRVFIPKEDYASLRLEKFRLGDWVEADNLYFWDNNYVGTWATTVNTAGFIRSAVFTDDFIYPFSDSTLKLPTGYEYFGETVWYPQFATSKNSETGEYETTAQVLAYDKTDLSSPFSYYTLGPSSDENYSISMYDVSWGQEYYYPSAEYYKGEWYTSEGQLSITEGENANEVIYNGETYTTEVVKDDDYGWVTYLKAGNKTLTLVPFVGGFTLKTSDSTLDAVMFNIEALKGHWLYGNKEIVIYSTYDDDWNEVLKVEVNGSEVTPTFMARNKKFAINIQIDGQEAYLTSLHANSVAVLSIGEEETYVCAREIYNDYFVAAGNMINSNSLNMSSNNLETLTFMENFMVRYNQNDYPVDYKYDENIGVVCASFEVDADTQYTLYILDENIFMLEKKSTESEYLIFAAESYLEGYVADWTKRGAKATLSIDGNYNVHFKNMTYSVIFDYDESMGFYMYFLEKNASAAYTLNLSLGTLKYSKIGYQGDDLAILEDAWYIKVEDYKKIEGTYIYVGERGKEYVVIDDSETVKITTNVNGNFVLKDYTGDNVRFSYYENTICLTFKDDGTNLYLYVYTDGIKFNFFNQLYYIQDVLVENQGYYSDGVNTLSIGGQSVYYNGSEAKINTAQNGELVFTVNGTTYSATFNDQVATVTNDGNEVTLAKKDFALKNYAGSWTIDNVNYSLTVKENSDGSVLYNFSMDGTSLKDYQLSEEDGKIVVTFTYLAYKYEIRIDENGEAKLTVASSIPLPPPPPPLAYSK